MRVESRRGKICIQSANVRLAHTVLQNETTQESLHATTVQAFLDCSIIDLVVDLANNVDEVGLPMKTTHSQEPRTHKHAHTHEHTRKTTHTHTHPPPPLFTHPLPSPLPQTDQGIMLLVEILAFAFRDQEASALIESKDGDSPWRVRAREEQKLREVMEEEARKAAATKAMNSSRHSRFSGSFGVAIGDKATLRFNKGHATTILMDKSQAAIHDTSHKADRHKRVMLAPAGMNPRTAAQRFSNTELLFRLYNVAKRFVLESFNSLMPLAFDALQQESATDVDKINFVKLLT
jgi:hypothetical protein